MLSTIPQKLGPKRKLFPKEELVLVLMKQYTGITKQYTGTEIFSIGKGGLFPNTELMDLFSNRGSQATGLLDRGQVV